MIYRKAVLESYLEQRSREFSRFFLVPTPGKIKKASKHIFFDRHLTENDIKILSVFFSKPTTTDFLSHINKIDAERFKSVQHFLKGETKNPEEDLVEFVSWLIDFKPRPYSEFRKNKGKRIDVTQTSISKTDQLKERKDKALGKKKENKIQESETELSNPNHISSKKTIIKKRRKLKIVFAISFSLILSSIFTIYSIFSSNKNCMNWVEDHYEKVICEEISYPQIALNKDLLENFKRVTLDTTMVFFEDGKPLYYYDRTDGKVEFFNQKGVHPIHGDSLRPITETIVRKYVYLEE